MHPTLANDFLSAHLADRRVFAGYLRILDETGDREDCQRAVRFAIEERHEAFGNEKLACQLLAKALSCGIGFSEALKMLLRLESRVDLYKTFSSPLVDTCYDCYEDPELQDNLDLLKRSLLEHTTPSSPCGASRGNRVRQ